MLHQKNINGIVQAQRWRWAMLLFAGTGAISFRPVFFCQPFRGMVPWTCPCLIWVYNPSVLFSQSENQLTNLIDPGFQAEGYPATAGRLTKGFWMTTFLVTSCFSSWSQKVKSSNLIVLLDVHSCQCLAMSFLVSFVFFLMVATFFRGPLMVLNSYK